MSDLVIRRISGAISALCGAVLAVLAEIPLPWFLGPLIVIATLRLLSFRVAAYRPLRSVGQLVIGLSLGLYFSPSVLPLIGDHWPIVLVGMVAPLGLSMFGTAVLVSIGNADLKTAWFSSAIGGASEMSVLAEKYGARVDLVATAHSLRILAVVIIVPVGFEFFGFSGSDVSALVTNSIQVDELFMALGVAVLGGVVFSRLGVSNAWVLGPLATTATLTLIGMIDTSVPTWLSNTGQLLIGWAIGDRYRPAFFKAAPRFLAGTAVFSVGAISLMALLGWGSSLASTLPLPTIWLGMAPGGLAEMAITAKVLALGVPIVTVMQATRMAFVVIVTGWIYTKILVAKGWIKS
jgi:uncharacterized protein